MEEATRRARQIKLVALDVDGVLTDGTLVFDRLTNLPRIEVLLPPGYEAIAANPGAAIDATGSRQRVTMESFGTTRVHVTMKKSAVPAP